MSTPAERREAVEQALKYYACGMDDASAAKRVCLIFEPAIEELITLIRDAWEVKVELDEEKNLVAEERRLRNYLAELERKERPMSDEHNIERCLYCAKPVHKLTDDLTCYSYGAYACVNAFCGYTFNELEKHNELSLLRQQRDRLAACLRGMMKVAAVGFETDKATYCRICSSIMSKHGHEKYECVNDECQGFEARALLAEMETNK